MRRSPWTGVGAQVQEVVAGRGALTRQLTLVPPWLLAVRLVVLVLAGLLPVALIVAGGRLGGRVAASLGSGDLGPVIAPFLLVMGLFLVGEVLSPFQGRLDWRVTKEVDGALRDRMVDAALSGADVSHLQGVAHLEAVGELQGLVRSAATPGQGAAAILSLTQDYLTVFAAVAVLATYQPLVALAVLVVMLVMRVRWRRATLAIVEVWREGDRARREGRYLSDLGLERPAQHEVRLFGYRDWLSRRIVRAGVEAWTPTWTERRAGMGVNGVWHVVLVGAATLVGLVWAAIATAHHHLDVADLVVFVPMMFLVLSFAGSSPDDTAIEYGVKLLPSVGQVERDARGARDGAVGSLVASDRPPSVQLHGVSFAYPGGAVVLREVDLDIPAGSSLAVVGLNGAGKTTLIRLLCGLHPPTTGRVAVDGVDLQEVALSDWHRLTAAIFQGFLRMPGDLADNVTVGAVDRSRTVAPGAGEEPGLEQALETAGVSGFAATLPDGVRTPLATPHVDGHDLSGGQWQRLAHARAAFALQSGARFLVLDEPTSYLDTGAEERLVQRLVEQTAGAVTTVLVTHRLALARRCDRVLVLAEGRVAELGAHAELMSRGGRYADAFTLQAGMYPWSDTAEPDAGDESRGEAGHG